MLIANKQILFVDILVDIRPGTVITLPLCANSQVTVVLGKIGGRHGALVAVFTQFKFYKRLFEFGGQREVSTTGQRKVTLNSPVRPLLIIDTLNKLRRNKIQVAVALSMPMAAHVNRHAVYQNTEISAVV